ncbi:MAG TPA: isoleucine--tRNA ligase [Terriglobales bacterium]|nr:isoleucine--tRNA ligase [Terriglobales bacterium]
MAAPPELKATLNLPRTDFAMKANLPLSEPKMLARWQHMRLYERIRQARQGAPVYVMHDGPPYANGPIHLGTALNKTLKDFVVKSRTMAGFDAPYVPGWDCHGLPIEYKVDNDLGRKKLQMQPLEVRQECRKYAEKYLDLQRSQFQRIGVFGRFEQPYSTMSPQYEAVVARTFFDFLEHGFVYKGLKPVYWCLHDRTALAEAEVEYENHTSPSIWVRYRLQSDPRTLDPALAEARILQDKPVYTIIWTTTPWTLPASMAVAFHPDEEYVALEAADAIYVVAARRATETAEKCGFPRARTLASLRGRTFEHTWFYHPFLPWPERKVLGVLGEYVTMDQGTGAVHTAPSHGPDDFYTGVKYKLDQTCNVDAGGHLRNGLPEYDGQTVLQANPHIVKLLAARGALLHEEKLEHSYPHCWRCHNPVIFRATEQWFISMEGKLEGGTLRSRSLEEIQKVKWDPAWGEERIANMIATRPDWCISRQRVWGVPIAVFFCQGCGELLRSPEANRAVVDRFASEGADAWYKHEAAAILPQGMKCPKCAEARFRKESDIIDVWFESGCSNLAVLEHEPGLRWPADLYVEAGDQYRGWFHSSLLCAVGTRNRAPYHGVATHGWTLDPQGRAMSKSLGNTVDPVDICKRLGGEIVRLWVASVDFREDVRNSEELMQRVAENYRKIRNTFRFILGNLHGFDPARDAVAFGEMRALDRYMLLRAVELAEQVREWYERFYFHRIYQAVNEFCVVDLSAVYFDVLKDRLYTSAPRSRARRSAQTAVWRIGEALVRLLAPMMSFTADEIWQALPALAGREESVHLALFPARQQLLGDAGAAAPAQASALMAEWARLFEVRAEVLKALEGARRSELIGSSLEAQVKILAPESLYPLLEQHLREGTLREWFIVSGVSLERSPGGNGATGIQVEVSRAPGQKCERCWNYSVRVGEDPSYPTVCERCSAALEEIGRG